MTNNSNREAEAWTLAACIAIVVIVSVLAVAGLSGCATARGTVGAWRLVTNGIADDVSAAIDGVSQQEGGER